MTPTTPAQPSPSTSEATTADEAVPEEQPADELWMPFRSWLEADPSRRVLLGAIALLAVQALVRGYVALGGWFLYDDLSFITRAATMPLWSTDYLLTGWNGHVMPGAFVWVHVLVSLAPLNYTVVALTDMAMQALVGYLTYRVLVGLFGRRPAVLIPLSVFLFTTITLPASLWWAAALNQLPGQAAAAGALLCHVAYHRRGRTWLGLAGVGCVLLGLLFSEKLLLIVPAIFAFTLLWFTPGPPVLRLRRALREHWPIWSGYGLVVVPYGIWYLAAVPSPVERGYSVSGVLQTAGVNLVDGILPALMGGPFRWQRLGIGAIADPPLAVVFAAALAASALVAWSVLRRHRAMFGWLVVAGYWAVNAAILGITRGTVFGPVIGREFRYSTDVALVVVVFGTLALIPVAGSFARGTPQRLLPRASATSAKPVPQGVRTSVGVIVTVAFIVAAALSTFAFDPLWRNDVTPRFVTTARADIARHEGRVTLAQLPFPVSASPHDVPLGATTSLFLALPPDERPALLTDGHATDRLSALDDQGHLRDVSVDGFANRPGPEKGCGYRVAQEPVTIPLKGTTMAWAWTTEIGYLASMEANATITVGKVTTPVKVHPGPNRVFVIGTGAIDSVTISGLSYGVLCTDEVAVGFARPTPGTGP